DLKVKFPDDYGAADVAGKEARFIVNVKEVHAVELPELNDEFAKSLGGVATVAEMKEAVKKAITTQKERNRRMRLQDQVAGQLLEKHGVSVPEAMVTAEVNVMLEREISNLRQRGMEPSGEAGIAELAKNMRPMAEKRAKLSLILESLAE